MLKSILSNTAAQLFSKVVAVALNFYVTILIMRLAGPGLFGDLTKAIAISAIGFTAIDFGLNAQAVRSMKGSHREKQQVLVDTVFTRLFLAALAVIVLNLAVRLLPGGYSAEFKSVFWLGSLSILFQGIYTSYNSWFQRNLQYWKMSLATVCGTVTGAAMTYWNITHIPSLRGLLLASTVGYAVMSFVSLFLAHPVNGSFRFSRSLRLLKNSSYLGLVLLASILASKLDSVILGVFRSSAEVGQYGFAYRIFDVSLVLPVFVMNAIYPLMLDSAGLRKKNLVRQSALSLLLVGIVASVVLYFASSWLVLIRSGMELAILCLRILAVSLPFFYFTAPLMWQLIESGLEKYLLVVYALAAVFNGIGNLIFVPRFGAPSSALLTGVTEAFILTGLYVVKRKYYGKS